MMKMRDEQKKIVSNALECFSLEMITSIIQNNYFITFISEGDKKYPIIDFTQDMDLDYRRFCEKSQRLYEEFALIPKWYEC